MKIIAIPIIFSMIIPPHLLAAERVGNPRHLAHGSPPASPSSPEIPLHLKPVAPRFLANPRLGSSGATVHHELGGNSGGSMPSSGGGGGHWASAGAETNGLIMEAILDKKDIGSICVDHARSTGLQGIGAFSNLGENEKNVLSEMFFDARAGGADNRVEGLETQTPPPLVGKHDCNGGYELKACYGLLQKTLNNHHQANFDNGFDPNLYLQWLELEKRIDAFGSGLKNIVADPAVHPLKSQEEMPELNQIQRDELLLDMTMEITAAIDYQAAHGNEAKVGELTSFLAKVNPSAAHAVACILQGMDYSKSATPGRDSRSMVGPLTGTEYSSFDKNSLIGIAPLVVIGVVRLAIVVGARIAARSAVKAGAAALAADPTTKAAVIGAAAGAVYMINDNNQKEKDREIARENTKIEEKKANTDRDRLEFEKQKEETRIEEGNRPGTITAAPETEKTEEEKEEEEREAAAKEKDEKREIPLWIKANKEKEEKLQRERDLLRLSSQYHFAEGDNFTSFCDGIFESKLKVANDRIKQDLMTTRSQEESYRLQEKQKDIIDYKENNDWNAQNAEQAAQCGQMHFLEGN